MDSFIIFVWGASPLLRGVTEGVAAVRSGTAVCPQEVGQLGIGTGLDCLLRRGIGQSILVTDLLEQRIDGIDIASQDESTLHIPYCCFHDVLHKVKGMGASPRNPSIFKPRLVGEGTFPHF